MRSGKEEVVEARPAATAGTGEVVAVRTTLERRVSGQRDERNKRGALLGLAALALAVAGVAFGLYKLISQNQYTTCGERRPL